MGNLYLRRAIEQEIEEYTREYHPPPEGVSDQDYYWARGRISGLRQVLYWLDRMDAGYRPNPGPEDLPPGAP